MPQAKLNVSDLRGRQVSLGVGDKAIVFTLPKAPPTTKDEVEDFIDLAARVEIALDPHVALVKLGQGIIRQLDQDVRDHAKAEIQKDGAEEEPTLFSASELAEEPGPDEEKGAA